MILKVLNRRHNKSYEGVSMNIKQKKIFRAFVLVLLLLLAGTMLWFWQTPIKPRSIPIGDYTYTIEYSKYRISQVMKQKHLPSFAVVLIDDQNIIWQETFGLSNIEKNQPAEPDTVYRLWSISKAFTAIETMRLIEDGLVNLDTPITTYIPDFALQSRFPDSMSITIRNILMQRSGLPRNGCNRVDLNANVLGNLVTSLSNCYQTYPVGYRYHYSNIGFDLLGYLIEEMRGKPFPDYLRDELLLPIGMENSAFLRSQIPDTVRIAPGYEYYKGEYYPYNQGDITSVPSGNLYGTIEDMGKFVQLIFRDGEVGGIQLVAPETLQEMFVEQVTSVIDPHSMGLGWKTNRVLGSELLVWHDGGPDEGSGALVAFLPERKLGVVLIANGTTFSGSVSVPLAVEFLGLMLETKYGLQPPPEKTQATVEIERAVLENYVGKYIVFGEVMKIYLEGDQIKGSVNGFSFNLDPLNETLFQPQHWLADIGLASLIGAPVDLRQLKIEFMAGDEISPDYLILNLGGFSYEICPEYPEFNQIPPLWDEILGDYEIVERLPSGVLGTEILGNASIVADNGVLRMTGIVGPVLPISKTELIVMSGVFAGETMIYNPDKGTISHQGVVFKRGF
jgi:CubicO group peptidase (beta-lactamase class C family)